MLQDTHVFDPYFYVTAYFYFFVHIYMLLDSSIFGSCFCHRIFLFWFIFLCYRILLFLLHISVTGYFCFCFIFLCYRILPFWFIFLLHDTSVLVHIYMLLDSSIFGSYFCYKILLFLVHISMLQDTSVFGSYFYVTGCFCFWFIFLCYRTHVFCSYFYVTGYFCFWFIFLCYMIILSSVYISMWQDINVFGSHFRVTEYSYFRFIFLLHDILKQLIIIYRCRKPSARTENGVSLLSRGNNFTWTCHGHFYPVNLQTTHVDRKWPWDRSVTRWPVSISFVNHNSLSFCTINVRYEMVFSYEYNGWQNIKYCTFIRYFTSISLWVQKIKR
jgi:hypothetical protein